jgi:predicted AAA+ superfamily ATPase
MLSGLAHLDKLNLLFRLLSANTAGELVQANLARTVGIPESSIHAYLRLLKDLCLILRLPAWGRNISDRAVSRPKVCAMDTGLASAINGVDEDALADVLNGEIFGPLLESFVIAELHKQQTWSSVGYSLFHFRDRAKREVDIIVELFDWRVIAIEVKASSTVSRSDFKGLVQLKETLGERFVTGIVFYTGKNVYSFGDRMQAMPIDRLWQQ